MIMLESQSWSRCPPTCVGQGVSPNSNLPGASLILYLNLLTHIYSEYIYSEYETSTYTLIIHTLSIHAQIGLVKLGFGKQILQ